MRCNREPIDFGKLKEHGLKGGFSGTMRVEVTDYVGDLRSLGANPGVAAYFDLDRTLITGYSVTALAWELVKSGSVPLKRALSQLGVFLDWGLGRVQYQDLMQATMNDLVGIAEQEFVELGERAYQNRLVGAIYQEGRKLIDVHRSLDHCVVMVTSATRAQAAPIARDLGIEHLLCTELEIENGCLTGGFDACYGESKRCATEGFAHARGLAVRDAYFYSDSLEDLALLEVVGHPVATNASSGLAKMAARQAWTELQFSVRGELRAEEAA